MGEKRKITKWQFENNQTILYDIIIKSKKEVSQRNDFSSHIVHDAMKEAVER